ncbi:SNF2-related protein [Streptomyces sp. NPDC006997]|uniref:DEAD/DEAH box helicase n=1 Tax=Streptomyces sp. NPDC006997 TaxID=3155356 RepID=UPI0033DB3779
MGRSERGVVVGGGRLCDGARAVVEDHGRAVEAVRGALEPICDAAVEEALGGISVGRLKEVTEGRLRLGEVERSGLRSVREVLDAGPYRLRQIPGVGQRTADQVVAAARQIADAVRETVAVQIDVDRPEPRTTALVMALHVLVEAGPGTRRAVDAATELSGRLGPLLSEAGPAGRPLRLLLTRGARRVRVLEAVAEVRRLTEEAERGGVPELFAQASVDLLRASDEAAAWVDFELRSAEYYSLLAEISGRSPDTAAAEGYLPDDVAERVREQGLDDRHRRVSLRGYQAFGARFALAQRKVILGDEMGLGKTIQALAVLAHLAAVEGRSHFLVVCPASVLINWTREIGGRSGLRALPLHGPERRDAFAEWEERGGVGVTTFDALRGFPVPRDGELGMLVVDEAHYVKNPATRRSRVVAEWAARCERVLFMTGTPMENRVSEFRSLVRLLRPELAEGIDERDGVVGSKAFRKAVAPVYLRRNQVDVLAELPALQHTDEWEELSASDEDAYREAVLAGNFMAMRRAAYARPEKSAKLERLREIVQDAAENGVKVVVFSYFRDVLHGVTHALERSNGQVFGPISGSVPPVRRQRLVDEFAAVAGHAVLVAQIESAGVGLNMQAASVVILCEPQVKPTIEHQAVARVHRMGQVRSVQVHRLLATPGVDERMVEMLKDKTRLFDAYARRSAVAESTPDAVDVSDTAMARQIVEEEQARLGRQRGARPDW